MQILLTVGLLSPPVLPNSKKYSINWSKSHATRSNKVLLWKFRFKFKESTVIPIRICWHFSKKYSLKQLDFVFSDICKITYLNHSKIRKWVSVFNLNYKANKMETYGSGLYIATAPCLTYWVAWNTRNGNPFKKPRDDNIPATGRIVNSVFPKCIFAWYF